MGGSMGVRLDLFTCLFNISRNGYSLEPPLKLKNNFSFHKTGQAVAIVRSSDKIGYKAMAGRLKPDGKS
jgi:hypothetical protein